MRKLRIATAMILGAGLIVSTQGIGFAFGSAPPSSNNDQSPAQKAANSTFNSAASGGAYTGDAQNKMGDMLDKANQEVNGQNNQENNNNTNNQENNDNSNSGNSDSQ